MNKLPLSNPAACHPESHTMLLHLYFLKQRKLKFTFREYWNYLSSKAALTTFTVSPALVLFKVIYGLYNCGLFNKSQLTRMIKYSIIICCWYIVYTIAMTRYAVEVLTDSMVSQLFGSGWGGTHFNWRSGFGSANLTIAEKIHFLKF